MPFVYFAAVIPVTDCCHDLLPIQFVIDPGDDFLWGEDDLNPTIIQKLTITNHDKIGLLNEYLDIAQVGLHCVFSLLLYSPLVSYTHLSSLFFPSFSPLYIYLLSLPLLSFIFPLYSSLLFPFLLSVTFTC